MDNYGPDDCSGCEEMFSTPSKKVQAVFTSGGIRSPDDGFCSEENRDDSSPATTPQKDKFPRSEHMTILRQQQEGSLRPFSIPDPPMDKRSLTEAIISLEKESDSRFLHRTTASAVQRKNSFHRQPLKQVVLRQPKTLSTTTAKSKAMVKSLENTSKTVYYLVPPKAQLQQAPQLIHDFIILPADQNDNTRHLKDIGPKVIVQSLSPSAAAMGESEEGMGEAESGTGAEEKEKGDCDKKAETNSTNDDQESQDKKFDKVSEDQLDDKENIDSNHLGVSSGSGHTNDKGNSDSAKETAEFQEIRFDELLHYMMGSKPQLSDFSTYKPHHPSERKPTIKVHSSSNYGHQSEACVSREDPTENAFENSLVEEQVLVDDSEVWQEDGVSAELSPSGESHLENSPAAMMRDTNAAAKEISSNKGGLPDTRTKPTSAVQSVARPRRRTESVHSRPVPKSKKVTLQQQQQYLNGDWKPNAAGQYPCSGCDKMFQTPSKLKRHFLCHSGIKPFTCDQCSRSFSQKINMQMHRLKNVCKPKDGNVGAAKKARSNSEG